MSGGTWNYQEYQILAMSEDLSKVQRMLRAVAETEHIIDWVEAGDTIREDGAETKVYQLWLDTFREIYEK